MLVSVCIASIGRETLLETINSIQNCELPESVLVEIIIADDSRDSLVSSLIQKTSLTSLVPISIYKSASANIALARNVCIENANGDFLAFIDDDEYADKKWIASYLSQMNSAHADAIFGPVNPIYPLSAKDWIVNGRPFEKRSGKEGAIVKTGSTSNAFIKRSSVIKYSLKFNVEHGKTGGEDTAFFYELYRKGGKLIASESALVFEKVPVERLSITHLKPRYIRGGQTYAKLIVSSMRKNEKVNEYIQSVTKVVILGLALPIIFLILKRHYLKLAFKFWLNLGKLRNLLNLPLINLY